MNKIFLNIPLILLLSGCSFFSSAHRTDSKGEPVNKNAPVFITPHNTVSNTNQKTLNKPEPAPSAALPATVSFKAERYVMVKENELNLLIEQRAKDKLKEDKKPNATAPITNKVEVNKPSGDSSPIGEISPTANVLRLDPTPAVPVAEKEKPSFFMHLLVVIIVILFSLTVGMLYFKPKFKNDEAPKPPVVPRDPSS